MKKSLIFAAISSTTIVLTACGDDVTNVTEQVGVQSFETIKKFPECSDENQGGMAMSKKDGKLYYCVDSSWVQMVAETSAGASGENGIDGKDGSDGKDGNNGENGKDGTSCTANELKDKSGFELYCANKLVGTIKNGSDGLEGKAGTNGTNCYIEDKGDGVLEVKCGNVTKNIYKAVCGSQPYDPENNFCFKDDIFKLCNGITYNPEEKICIEKVLYDNCGEKVYNPKDEFCFEGELYSCANKPYNPTKEFCFHEDIYKFCNGMDYEPPFETCRDGIIYGNLFDERDYTNYRYVKIGKQTWMAENLNYETENSSCYKDSDYPDEYDNCQKHGRLYTWAAAMGKTETECGYGKNCGVKIFPHQGVFPEGWYLPSDDDWIELLNYIARDNSISNTDVSIYLKSNRDWNEYKEFYNGNNKYGFTALPSGYGTSNGDFIDMGEFARFWTSIEGSNGTIAYNYTLSYKSDVVLYDDEEGRKNLAFSVRCLKK